MAVFKNKQSLEVEYEVILEKAIKLEEKGIYIDAIDLYQKAHKIKPNNYDIAMRIVNSQKELNDEKGFIAACDMAIKINPSDDEVYLLKANYFIDKNAYKTAFDVLGSATQVKDDSAINALLESIKYEYINKFLQCHDMKNWYSVKNSSYSTVKVDEKWGINTSSGNRALRYEYDYLGRYSQEEKIIPCMRDGEYYYIDIKGNKKLVGDEKYQYLGSFGDGFAPAQRNDKFGYIDRDFNEFSFDYDFAGGFAHGIAAVKRNEKWAIIDSSFKTITDFTYDDILVDDYGFCSEYGVFFAKKDGEYKLYNSAGEQISSRGYSSAKLFTSKEPAAVEVNDEWGWIDINGEQFIEPQYKDAQSFSLNLAPVLIDGIWGYINADNKIAIEPNFEYAKPFSKRGSAFVKNQEKWNLITLYEYDD
ncbi:MAG: hypothetical protein GX967_01025 [Clostridiales bacterium]|nr:hypothetical protein [Clostridiales bacterium]